MILNTIQDGSGRLIQVVAGHQFSLSYRGEAIFWIYQSKLPGKRTSSLLILILRFRSLACPKGIYASELAVKQGGIVILITHCPEGVSPSHPEILEWAIKHLKKLMKKSGKERSKKLTAAAISFMSQGDQRKGKGILVSTGISKEETERLGFFMPSLPGSIRNCFFLIGTWCKGTVLKEVARFCRLFKIVNTQEICSVGI